MPNTLPTTVTLVRHNGFWSARWPGDDPERVRRIFEDPIALTPINAKADGETAPIPDRVAELG